jgi:hypothetical protein
MLNLSRKNIQVRMIGVEVRVHSSGVLTLGSCFPLSFFEKGPAKADAQLNASPEMQNAPSF